MVQSRVSLWLRKEANTLLLFGGAFSAAFFSGGYYFSMKEKYEKQVAALELQLEHERDVRELHDDIMMQKLHHERDQQALAILHLRRHNENMIHESQIDQQRWLFELAFHGDYEKYSDQVSKKDVMEFLSSAHQSNQGKSEKNTYSKGSVTAVSGDPNEIIDLTLKDNVGYPLTTLSIPANTKVGDLKYKIEDHLYIPTQNQRLYYKGTKINDGPSLQDYEITDGSTIHLKIKKSRPRERARKLIKKKSNSINLPNNPNDINVFFYQVDVNRDKTVSAAELERALQKEYPLIPKSELKDTVLKMDVNNSGYVSHKEWYEYCINQAHNNK